MEMATAGYIYPRTRLLNIPDSFQLAHEYCYFLHDQCLHMLTQYETANAHLVEIKFTNSVQKRTFLRVAKKDRIEALLAIGCSNEARRVIINNIIMALVSDALLHLYEALQCLEKRKSIVAFNLLRKPLMDNLTYLSWILSDENGFYESFMSNDPRLLTSRRLGAIRQEIIAQALAKTHIAKLLDANFVWGAIFDSKNANGLYGLFQHAVHLITVDRIELQTSPQNFNFVFKNPFDDDVYEHLYSRLPALLIYLTHVILELFDRMKSMDSGAKMGFFVRSVMGFDLLESEDRAKQVQAMLTTVLPPHFHCERCRAPVTITFHNACRIVLSDSFRCIECRYVQNIPFSWVF